MKETLAKKPESGACFGFKYQQSYPLPKAVAETHKWTNSQPFIIAPLQLPQHRFSASWLRSSVVSVLISLITDSGSIDPLVINLIFGLRK